MVYTWFRRVYTCLYRYKLVYTRFNFYKHVYTMYMHVCTAYVWCTEGYIHFLKCTDIVEHGTYIAQTLLNTVRTLLYLFDSAFLFALLAGLLAGPGCCQVSRLFKFKHTSLIGIRLCHAPPHRSPSREGLPLRPPTPLAFPGGLAAAAAAPSSPPPPSAGAAAAALACGNEEAACCGVATSAWSAAASSLPALSSWSSNLHLTTLGLLQPLAPRIPLMSK